MVNGDIDICDMYMPHFAIKKNLNLPILNQLSFMYILSNVEVKILIEKFVILLYLNDWHSNKSKAKRNEIKQYEWC